MFYRFSIACNRDTALIEVVLTEVVLVMSGLVENLVENLMENLKDNLLGSRVDNHGIG